MFRTILGLLVAVGMVLFGSPAAGDVGQVGSHIRAPNTYHCPHYDGPVRDSAPERGPPATYDRCTTYDAVDYWSRGASVRPDTATSRHPMTYDDFTLLGQVAGVMATTREKVGRADGELSALSASRVAANSGSRIAANQAAGNAARDQLLAGYPRALPEQSFTTTAGVRRLDILTQGGLGIESKVGRTSLTATTRSQIAKDGLLLRSGDVTGIEWVFSRSGVTGQIGPTGPLADALRQGRDSVETGAVSIDWDGYEPFDPGASEPPRVLPRAEARRVFTHCMETKPARLKSLRRLLKSNGVELTSADSSVQDLNDWFFANVEADPDLPGRLLPIWHSVCHDVALFLGEVMIERHPNLHWEFFSWGKTNVAFQRHVIMGMSTEDPKFHTNIDIDRMVATYAHQIIESRGSIPSYGTVEVRGATIDVDAIAADHRGRELDTEAFWHWMRMAAERA